MAKPEAIDLYCGLGGWADGLLAEGYDVTGYDIEAHDYGTGGYPGNLVLRDVRSIHGSEFRHAALIVGSSPCQEFSYRAMPWKRAKALPPPYLGMELFNAQFRIQREASEAAGHHIPMVVENVRGAQKYVGRAVWHYGSYYLWGDVPALMPMTFKAIKVPAFRFDGSGKSFQTASVDHTKTNGHANIRDGHTHTRHLTNQREIDGVKIGTSNGKRFDERPKGCIAGHREGTKVPGIKINEVGFNVAAARRIDVSNKPMGFVQTADMKRQHIGYSRKAASAMIAKIPMPLALHIARVFKPEMIESSAELIHG